MCLNSKQATEKQRKVTKCEMKVALLFPAPAAPVPASEDVLSRVNLHFKRAAFCPSITTLTLSPHNFMYLILQ